MKSSPSLHRLTRFTAKPATEDELKEARAFFHEGMGQTGKIGILLIHGFSTTTANYAEYIAKFTQQGYTVSAPLLTGHGENPEALKNVSWKQWLNGVIENYDILQSKCEKIFVIGFSLGGLLALQLAATHQNIAKLFLISPAIKPTLLFKIAHYTLFPLLSLLGIQYWFPIGGDVKNPLAKRELGYNKISIHALNELWRCMQQTLPILPTIKTNTLIFQGRSDHVINPQGAMLLQQNLNSTSSELVWLENSYHVVPIDFDSEAVFNRILQDIQSNRI